MPYTSKQAAVDALRPGYRITGEAPNMVTVPNPKAGLAGQPATLQEQQGSVITIDNPSDPSLPPDTIVIKQVGNAPWKGGVGYDVVQGPTKAVPAAAGKPSDPSKWEPIYRTPGQADSGLVAQWDPVNKEYHPVAAPQGAQPTGKFDPVYREPNKPESGVIALIDTGDKSFHPVAGDPGAKPSGTYTNVPDPRDPTGKRIIGMVDTGSKAFHALAQDPASQKQVVTTPTKIFVFDNEGQIVNEVDVDRTSPYQAVIIDGTPYRFDPNEKDPTKAFSKAPGDWQHPPIKDANGLPMTWDEAQGKYAYPAGVTPAATLSTVTTAPFLEWYDQQGNLINRVENQNYRAPQTQQGTQSTTAPMIQQWNPKTGQWDWVENKGRVTASEALQNMASVLSGQVVDGKISVDEAKELIAGANQTMTSAVSAASNVLDYTAKGAQTGAGMLQQRAATAQGMLGQVLGLAGQGQSSKGYGGGLQSVPAGLGAELVGGIAGYTADLMGGQGTLDAAAKMVQAAGGGDAASPAAATAISTLTQMLDKYRALSGTDHPVMQAQRSAQQSAQANGIVAPQPNPAPIAAAAGTAAGAAAGAAQNFTAPPWQRADQMYGTTPPGNALAQPGMAGTVPPDSPNYMGFTAPPTPQAQPTIVMNF
jgi:hypothetical protein